MLKDYKRVLLVMEKLNSYAKRVYGKALADIDKGEYRSVLDRVYYESAYCQSFLECKKAWGEIDVTLRENGEVQAKDFWPQYIKDVDMTRNVEEMSENDIMTFLNSLTSSQVGDFIIIRYNEYRIFNNFVMLGNTYDAYEGLLRECRSFVFNVRTLRVVSLPYYKFMNRGEATDYMEPVLLERLKRAKLVEYSDKMDGSFIQITMLDKVYDFYKYPELLTSSKNILNTETVVLGRKWYETQPEYKNLVRGNPEYTFMFEMIDPEDKHVVRYNKDQYGLYLIGMRHKETGEIVSYHNVVKMAEKYGVRHTTVYDITYSEMQESLTEYKASQKEGYVVNIDGFLVKIKCDEYRNMVALLRGGEKSGNANSVIIAISNDSLGELISTLPEEYHEDVNATAKEVYAYIELAEKTVNELVNYLLSVSVQAGQAASWCKKLPKPFGGVVRTIYFNKLRGIDGKYQSDFLRTNNVKMQNNYINHEELKRRRKTLTEFKIDQYKTL